MINFWIVAALLTVLACLFIVVPSIRYARKEQSKHSEDTKASREQENVNLYKERLSELEQEVADGRVTSELYEQRKQELELALLNDVQQGDDSVSDTTQNNTKIVLPIVGVSLVFVVIFSVYLYQENGFKELVDEYHAMNFNAQELEKAKDLAKQGDMSALLKQLHDKLKAAPNNLEGWQLLANSAMNSQRYSLAIEAYEQIINIYESQDVNPAPIYGLIAQAQYYQSEGKLTADVEGTIKKAFELDENELNSIGLLAIDAFSKEQFLVAKDYWLKILSIYPEHPARASIEAGISRANAQLGIEDSVTPSAAWLDVSVSVDDAIKSMLDPNDTVFIIAKNNDPNAPNVPLAVSRHSVSDLPITVKLDDSKSMAPVARISMAQSVVVIARISKSGNPIAQPGDFEAVSADLSPSNQESIELLIQNSLN